MHTLYKYCLLYSRNLRGLLEFLYEYPEYRKLGDYCEETKSVTTVHQNTFHS